MRGSDLGRKVAEPASLEEDEATQNYLPVGLGRIQAGAEPGGMLVEMAVDTQPDDEPVVDRDTRDPSAGMVQLAAPDRSAAKTGAGHEEPRRG